MNNALRERLIDGVRRTSLCAMLLAFTVGSDLAFGGNLYSVGGDFSIDGNPNGPWTYGYSDGLGGPLIPYVSHGSTGPLEGWWENILLGAPGVSYNRSPDTVTNGTVQYAPWQAIFHPGPSGQACIYRFIAPVAGDYEITASFAGADLWGTSTNVHILHDGLEIFSGVVSGMGPGTGPSFAASIPLAAGSTVDFAVTTSNSFYNDSTGIEATLDGPDAGCPADLDGDGLVGAADLALLLGAWASIESPADLDGDGAVGAGDLALLLGAWGDC